MAASANPTGNHQEGSSNQNVTPSPPPTANGVAVNSNNSGGNTSTAAAAAVSADTQSALRHNPGISLDWTPEEQTMLEDLLVKFEGIEEKLLFFLYSFDPLDELALFRTLKPRSSLHKRHLANYDWTCLRFERVIFPRYTSDSTIVRYAKIAMQLKDKTVREVALRCRWMTFDSDIVSQEKGMDTSAKSTPHLTTRPNGPSYALPMIPMDNDDGIPYEGLVKTYIREDFTVFQYKNYSWAETLS
ncbi:hypothetical protein GOBAR_AA23592 [Gossypium barbadense]|uniref:Uncharacterized protein n=1 Tax=Gossypium barbadense TaxID=3634 RepID=A0A2P5X159_GOSBA|nr:hypothetical protein GOBAR_AA23592 [Gossypium barbadense]